MFVLGTTSFKKTKQNKTPHTAPLNTSTCLEETVNHVTSRMAKSTSLHKGEQQYKHNIKSQPK